jgi:hypothetical protein
MWSVKILINKLSNKKMSNDKMFSDKMSTPHISEEQVTEMLICPYFKLPKHQIIDFIKVFCKY